MTVYSLSALLLAPNPRTGRPDHLATVARLVLYGYWLPAVRLAAVNIIRLVAASPAHQPALLACLTSSPGLANSVLRAFSETLDLEEGECEDASEARLAVLQMLQVREIQTSLLGVHDKSDSNYSMLGWTVATRPLLGALLAGVRPEVRGGAQ